MIVEVQHETCLTYSDSVTESLAEVRMEPVSDEHQSCRSFSLMIKPGAEVFRYQDGFGNRVHHFNVLSACRTLGVVAASVVETHPANGRLASSRATWPLNLEALEMPCYGFLGFRGPVRATPLLEPLLERLCPNEGCLVGEFVLRVADYIAHHFEYARDVTLASSPIDDLLSQGKGVCQDFTHLMIAVLRSFQIPARYVSGYIHRPNKDSQSHAWVEAWLPDVGWCGIDPTNRTEVNEHFIKVAVGRDFSDVAPNKGVYRGRAEEGILVRVETRALERLPSLQWQEKLPPFEVPLTPVMARSRHALTTAYDDGSQQQQQQQQ
ncbi:MAG TPA: transglutaminase family protein [Pirellulales bacterium]|nr:transglutaminase family protein [Pirellulales bacterium]